MWQRLVGHVHRGAGNGANGLADRLLNFAVHDRAELSSLLGARLGGHVLEQVARLALQQMRSIVEKRTALMWPRRIREMFTGEMSMRWESSLTDILRSAITRSRRGIIGITAPLHGFVAELL